MSSQPAAQEGEHLVAARRRADGQRAGLDQAPAAVAVARQAEEPVVLLDGSAGAACSAQRPPVSSAGA